MDRGPAQDHSNAPAKASWTGPTPQAELGADATSTQRLQPRSLNLPLKQQHIYRGEYKSTQQVQPHSRRGIITEYANDKSRIRLRLICSKAKFYTCKCLFLKRLSQNNSLANNEWGWSYTKDPNFNATDSSAVAHGITTGHLPKRLTP